MRQVNDANWQVPYIGGWCLGYVEMAWGLATMHQDRYGNWYTVGKYNSATDAWNNAQGRHYNVPPLGITVPVYFSLGSTSDGHIAIRLSDGTVASSTMPGKNEIGYIHPSLDAMISMYARYNNGCAYRGWSEELAGKIIVEEDGVKIGAGDNWRNRFNRIHHQLVRNADMPEAVFQSIVGKDAWEIVESWSDHSEANKLIGYQEVGEIATKDGWADQIHTLVNERDNILYPRINEYAGVIGVPTSSDIEEIRKGALVFKESDNQAFQAIIDEKNKTIEELQKQIASGGGVDSELAKDTNKKVNKIWSYLTSIFKKKA